MKKLFVIAVLLLSLTGCNAMTKNFGGKMEIKLEPGQKLELVTWKDSNLWYLTRDMRTDENPEVYYFIEKSNLNVLEGKITIIEMK